MAHTFGNLLEVRDSIVIAELGKVFKSNKIIAAYIHFHTSRSTSTEFMPSQ